LPRHFLQPVAILSRLQPQNRSDPNFKIARDPAHPFLGCQPGFDRSHLGGVGILQPPAAQAFARASPARTLSRIMARSNSAKTPII
jgi:hypothetical protein